MRNLKKLPIPAVLAANAVAWLADFLAEPDSKTKRTKYRHDEIKTVLRQETAWKCVYCESKIGHNTPGDVEHKVPTSKDQNLHFDWSNLTIACTECNRRKSDYYQVGSEFLDPYADDVEAALCHLGPIVYAMPGHERAEVTVRKLELDAGQRAALVERKLGALEKARALLEVHAGSSELMRTLRRDEVLRMCAADAEFSAMVKTYVDRALARSAA